MSVIGTRFDHSVCMLQESRKALLDIRNNEDGAMSLPEYVDGEGAAHIDMAVEFVLIASTHLAVARYHIKEFPK